MEYDEFGNPLGDLVSDADDDVEADVMEYDNDDEEVPMVETRGNENAIILREDKKYYMDAKEMYENVNTVTLDEDAQDISEPIIKSTKTKVHIIQEQSIPNLKYSPDFLGFISNTPALIRNIGIFGQLHHGKTMFVDTLVKSIMDKDWDQVNDSRYTDFRKDEQARELSIKSTPLSILLENSRGKSHLVNLLDCPGHINFFDEAVVCMSAVDGAVIVVDAIEGVMFNTEKCIKLAVESNVSICLVINKIDRLILELKIPPQDAYYKLLHTIEEVNSHIAAYSSERKGITKPQRVSPELGNVCFSSAYHDWSFTLSSYANIYCNTHPTFTIDSKAFAKRLWGDWYHDKEKSSFTKIKSDATGARTFVEFVLEPIYKIYSHFIGGAKEEMLLCAKSLGLKSNKGINISMDPKPLLRSILSNFFGYPHGFTDMITEHVKSPVETASVKCSMLYSGLQTSEIATSIQACNSDGPLMIHVMKLYSGADGSSFKALGRIYSGTVNNGQKVKVLGELYSDLDDEDMKYAEITGLSISVGRFFIQVNAAVAGNWIMIDGIDSTIKKTATITDTKSIAGVSIFRPFYGINNASVVKLAIEPLNPVELPRLIEGLRRINKSYPGVTTRVEDSGEHIILAPGELYLDCVMYDLRNVYSEIEIKVADPVVSFNETVSETSSRKCISKSPNGHNAFTMIAEPLDQGLAEDIENGNISLSWDRASISNFYKSKYNWDALAARSVWAFGPDPTYGANILMNDTIPSEIDVNLLNTVKDNLVQGFQWSCREGPLCDEPIRKCKFKILDADISSNPIQRGGGQIIPTARRNAYSSFFTASPRLMEPIYKVEMQAPADCVQAIYPVLQRRRGHVYLDSPKPGSPFFIVKAFLPVIDSFGFETDLRSYTQGQVFCQQIFDHWALVPGDPLDENIIIHPLEPSPPVGLARDFLIKTRRRKGLPEDVNISKYFDELK